MTKVNMNVRIPPELRIRLQAQAARENRTLASLVEMVMLLYLKEYEPQHTRRNIHDNV